MSTKSPLKRALLQQAVYNNVDVIKGRVRFRKKTKREHAHAFARIFFLVAVPVTLFGSSYVVSAVAGDWLETRRVAQLARAEEVRIAADKTRVEVARAEQQAAEAERERAEAEQAAVEAHLQAVREEPALLAASSNSLSAPRPLDRSVFPLAVRTVIIDPGHGGDNVGTEAPDGVLEKTLALDISKRLEELLAEASYQVAMTRQDDEFVSLDDRAALANENGGDIFVSIHLNWIEERQVRGVETYFLGATDDPYLNELAARENRDSGYSVNDFRRLLERVFVDVRQGESQRLATEVQRGLYDHLRKVNPQVEDRGVKKAPFVVLTGTEMPAILAEVSCLSNEKEARLLTSPGYRQYIAEALFSGIDTYARSIGGSNQIGS
ncbi:MAG: N-acetylmuramoyl-L-alanine amidase [Acidobacteriota bacterium]|nr:N-acetylmuramoyl-L-alanine amidase [Acidobacteriota bacterium]